MDDNPSLPLLDDASIPVATGDSKQLSQRLQAKYSDRITGSVLVPGRAGSYAPLPRDLPAALAEALKTRGIDQLYSHQSEAWHAVREGEHVVIVTPDRFRQDALLHLAGSRRRAMSTAGQGAVPVSDQGAGAGPGRRVAGAQPRRRSSA